MDKTNSLFLAFLLYIPSLYFIPNSLYILPFIFLLITGNYKKVKFDINFLILSVFIFTLLLIYLFNIVYNEQLYFFWFILWLTNYIVAKNINQTTLRYLLFFIILETFFIWLEVFLGVENIFLHATQADTLLFSYEFRPLGLSDGSPLMGQKLFLAILILLHLNIKEKTKLFLIIYLLLMELMVFNRTAILTTAFVLLLYSFNRFSIFWKVVLSITGVLFVSTFFQTIFTRFNRDQEEIYLSGRDYIWQQGLEFIKEHLLFGNLTQKVHITYIDATSQHLHNIYLQYIGNFGIIFTFFYLLFVIINIKKNNFIYISAILLYGIFQYGIGWGISLMDILFFYFLFLPKRSLVC